jgi:hypothetical protein
MAPDMTLADPTPDEAFCLGLARACPGLGPVLAEHIADNDTGDADESPLLPYVFLADVGRYLAGQPPDKAAIIDHIDAALATRPELNNLITVGFIESILDPDEFEPIMKGVAGPHIRQEWKRMYHGG